ncbi:hypothetical protein DE146DRAFT_627191 [Phaeosphaeria sp. MPI-PUGE-AT-0046c]|nr:hypothetical protein DE146DRAFT_627191 [Phaeosphaeria sp. MPI-PUGE-AT-0046c]
MSMIISNAGRLKPELRLAEAISQFEAHLSTDEKAAFRTQRAQAIHSAPGIDDVMRFTAQIDSCIVGRAKRCFGPRFTNIISTVQQFAALGDVILGGSQNIVACGVWSLVRMSILAMTRFSTLLETMSVIFMEIGRRSPRHQELALMYPRSKRLQADVNEYFIVVVRFCQDIFRFTQRSLFSKMTTALGRDQIQLVQSELDRWAHEIGQEVYMLIAKRLEDESVENSRFRSVSKILSKSTMEHQQLVIKLRILDGCSTYDYTKSWKQIRKCGNTTIFTQHDAYKSWKSSIGALTLLYVGKLGCGKSVTLANMIDDLNLNPSYQRTQVIYFFTRHDLPESLQARTIIGSLVRQLLDLTNQTQHFTVLSVKSPDVQTMCALLRSCYRKRHRFYLILDGLDLCAEAEEEEVIEFLRILHMDFCVLTCVSRRRIPARNSHTIYENFPGITKVLTVPENSSDIASYIEAELVRCLKNESLILGDANLILKIQDSLLDGSDGMFLWAALQIKALCELHTDHDILEALANLPLDLSNTYRRILQKAQGRNKLYQELVLRLLTAAQVPLNISEIREALSVEPGQTDWTSSRLLNDVYSALATCGCVIYVDEEDLTVRYVHSSVREYFLHEYPIASVRADNDAFERAEAVMQSSHRAMAEVIVTYLSYGVFDNQLSTTRIPHIDGSETTSKIVRSATASSKNVQSLALKLLAHRSRPTVNIGKTLARSISSNAEERKDFVFVHYARDWCLDHVCAVRQLSLGRHVSNLLIPLLHRNAHNDNVQPSAKSAYAKAVEQGNESLLCLLLDSTSRMFFNHPISLRFMNTDFIDSPMTLAICRGHEVLMERLKKIDGGAWIETESQGRSISPCTAVYMGDVDKYRFYQSEENTQEGTTDPEYHVCQSGRGPLACAIWGGDTNMIKHVLASSSIIILGRSDRHPVMEALIRQDIKTLCLLRDSEKIELRLQEQEKRDYIAEAIGMGFWTAVEVLEVMSAIPMLNTIPDLDTGPPSAGCSLVDRPPTPHPSTKGAGNSEGAHMTVKP